ncbi:hypothetical protein PAN31117_04109 [Pandoraea anapnoica]|uniref:GIY-YIG domain-containing protein n=1 Tax=Pandoraea anapnoica TaxID=2508301 RepID=A0A5E5AD79_9BURK|nr:GIY-YIG nuclease family protein [Pandoraea anapnoica]VVE71601.1 hypothetical protein PAN31117_04109 [Pandoraea anapnoica]
MEQLIEIGFQPVGRWMLSEDGALKAEVDIHAKLHKNVLYAFVVEGQVMYVGKSTTGLRQRFQSYATPGKDSSTNVRCHQHIREHVEKNTRVEILSMADKGLHKYGSFHLNLAAGLEDSIIAMLKPSWNGEREVREAVEREQVTEAPATLAELVTDSFSFNLAPAYRDNGFFNVPVRSSRLLGNNGETLELLLGDDPTPQYSIVNRTSNKNGSVRLYCSQPLKRWFKNISPNTRIEVDVVSPLSIHLLNPISEG